MIETEYVQPHKQIFLAALNIWQVTILNILLYENPTLLWRWLEWGW